MIGPEPRATGCPLHLAHATMNFAANKGRAGELLALLDAALADGVRHHAWTPTPTCPAPPRSRRCCRAGRRRAAPTPRWPGWPIRRTRARIREERGGQRLRRLPRRGGRVGHHRDQRGRQPDARRDHVGRTVAEIAAETGARPVRRLRRPPAPTTGSAPGSCSTSGHEENVQAIMQHRTHTGGSDGLLVGAKPHPRAWGTFPRYLGHYCRDLGLLSLEEMRRPPHRPAPPPGSGCTDRGLVRDGYAADLVLFDPDTVADAATFDEPAAARGRHPLRLRQRHGRHRRRAPTGAPRRPRAAPQPRRTHPRRKATPP